MEPDVPKLVAANSILKECDFYDRARTLEGIIRSISVDSEEAAALAQTLAVRLSIESNFDGNLHSWIDEFIQYCWEESVYHLCNDGLISDSDDESFSDGPSSYCKTH